MSGIKGQFKRCDNKKYPEITWKETLVHRLFPQMPSPDGVKIMVEMDEWEEHILESVYEENVHGWDKARRECSDIVERLAALAAEVKSEAFSKKVEPTEVMRNEAWAVLLSYIARFGEPKCSEAGGVEGYEPAEASCQNQPNITKGASG